MKDNKLVCCVRLNGRVGYFYSCQHTFTDVFKTHRALKKAHKPCDCGGNESVYNKNPILFEEAISGVEQTWYQEAQEYLMDDDLIELKRLFGQM